MTVANVILGMDALACWRWHSAVANLQLKWIGFARRRPNNKKSVAAESGDQHGATVRSPDFSITSLWLHGNVDVVFGGEIDSVGVSGIDVADDAHSGITR